MAVTFPASAHYATTNLATGVASGSADFTGCDLLYLAVAVWDSSISVADSLGNTWTLIQTSNSNTQQYLHTYYAKNATVGASQTFTITHDGASDGNAAIMVLGMAGTHLTAPLDQYTGTGTIFVSTLQPGSITPTADNEVVLSAFCFDNNGGITATVDSGMTAAANNQSASPAIAGAYIIQTTAGAINPTWTSDFNVRCNAHITSFKAAAAGGSVGSASGTGTASGVAASKVAAVASASGAGTATGVAASTVAAVGSASGTGTATGVGRSTVAAVGAASGTGTASGVSASTVAAIGSATGTGTAAGVAASSVAAVGSATGTGTASGVAASSVAAVGSAAGTGTATGVAPSGSVGAATGTGTATGIGASTVAGVGAASGTGAATGVAASSVAAVGAASGTGTAAGVAASTVAAVGAGSGTGTASGVAASTDASVGAATGTGTASGVAASTVAAVGSATGTGTATGYSPGGSVGTAAGTGTATGVAASTAASVGAAAGAGAATGVGASTVAAVGAASGTGTAAAVGLTVVAAVGSASATGSAAGVGASTVAGVGAASGNVIAVAFGASTVAGVGSAHGTGVAIGISPAETVVVEPAVIYPLMMSWTEDGQNWSAERWRDLGAQGTGNRQDVRWNGLGTSRARGRIFRFRASASVVRGIRGASVDAIALPASGGSGSSAPHLMMQWTEDGQNWSTERWRGLGVQGDGRVQVAWSSLGTSRGRGRIFRFSASAAVVRGIRGASVDAVAIAA